ncbi:MAG TPA: glycosyltransferase family 4 protein [Vicinamibacterales bacterium]|nr:glycosyltransferase family 4 protein [Vicinamibacterales bacterium]
MKPFRIGSNESFARELSRQLGDRGWNSIQCFQDAPPDAVRQFLQLPNVTVQVFEDAPSSGLRPAAHLAKLLRQHRPQILHLHFTGFLGAFPWVARACSVGRVFITDQTSRPEGYTLRRAPFWKRSLTRVINQPVTRVMSVSQYGYDCMTALDVLPRDRFRMIYNSIELSRVRESEDLGARFRAKHGIPADRPLVVQVSWIIPEKGILDLLEAARLIASRGMKVHFAFVGDGSYRQQYAARAAEMGLTDFITWTGVAQDPFAEGVYAAADVVCQVSRWEEVFGWTIAEAMAHRKPLIGTRVGGIPELVTDGVTGFLVERGDAAAMAEKIALLVESPALRTQMGLAGRQQVELKFDLTKNVSRLLDIYGIGSSAE